MEEILILNIFIPFFKNENRLRWLGTMSEAIHSHDELLAGLLAARGWAGPRPGRPAVLPALRVRYPLFRLAGVEESGRDRDLRPIDHR